MKPKTINIKTTLVSRLIWLLLLISNIYKLFLVKGGFLTEPDERLYFKSFSFLKRLSTGNLSDTIEALFSARGRPVEVLLKSIPASIQFVWAKIFHLNVFETKNMWIIFGYNFIVYLLILYLLYKISFLIFKEKTISIFVVFLYSSLVNSYVYLRHIYPYDTSLLLLILLTWILLKLYIEKSEINYKKSFSLGILAFLSFMIYPTFYMSFFALFFLFVWIVHTKTGKTKTFFYHTIAYVSGSVFTLGFYEMLARSVSQSYINNLLQLSGTIDQGDYDESVMFLFKYLWEVEGVTGIIVLLLFVVFLFQLPKFYKNKTPASQFIFYLFVFQLFFYLIHTLLLCQIMQKMTVYIRQMHQYMPLLALFVVYGLYTLKINVLRNMIVSILSVLIFVNTIYILHNYLTIAYPRDVYWKYLRRLDRSQIKEITEYTDSWSNLPFRFLENEKTIRSKDTIIAVNTFYFFPVVDDSKYKKYVAPQDYQLFYKAPHFLNFRAYQFEGYNRKERKNIRKMNFHIKLYKQKN